VKETTFGKREGFRLWLPVNARTTSYLDSLNTMYMITPIDIVDSAVKIGLGALISGFATYWLTKLNHDQTAEKERAQRKRALLEAIAEQVAKFDQFALDYWERVANWLAVSPRTEKMSESLRGEISQLEKAIKDGYEELKSAETKLSLLGEIECQWLLREYGLFVAIYRQDAIEARKLSVGDLKRYKELLREKLEGFLSELSKSYMKI